MRLVKLAVLVATALTTCVAQAGIMDGLVAYYDFDGNVLDQSGNGNDGSLVNGTGYTAGVYGQAANFDGVDDHITFLENTNLDGFSAFSIGLWIKPTQELKAGSGRQDFFYKGASPSQNQSYLLNYDDAAGKLQFNAHSDASHFVASSFRYESEFSANEWFHVAITYDGISMLQMFVNGLSVGSEFSTGLSGPINDTSSPPFRMGSRTDDLNHFDGALDDFRIYDRQLSLAEVSELATTVPAPVGGVLLLIGLLGVMVTSSRANTWLSGASETAMH